MTLENCPMCHSAVSHEGLVKACASCGADLTRWLPKPPKLQVVQAMAAAPRQDADDDGRFNMGLGVLGAFVGAGVGAALMFAFFLFLGLRFPLFGTGIGALTALGARLLYKGGDHNLGLASAGIAAVSVIGTLYLMYGEFPIMNIISVLVSISIAYRFAAK